MKKAYIIAVHKYPEFLCRLVNRLNDGHSDFYIHIDLSVNSADFDCLKQFGSKIRFVERTKSAWATMGQVYSSLNALKAIVASAEPYEMVHFLSGQDYPIKSNKEIDRFFRTSEKTIFLEYFSIPDFEKWANGGAWRVDKYFVGLRPSQFLFSKTVNLLARYIPLLQRKLPAGMKPYAGSAWFSMDLHAVKYVLKYVEENPRYTSFQKYSFSPDELFYLMILINSPDSRITSKIENNNKRFIKWKTNSSANPEILTVDNFDEIKNSDCMFARKFDPHTDSGILDMIDSQLLLQ